jgi:hypothetical protein
MDNFFEGTQNFCHCSKIFTIKNHNSKLLKFLKTFSSHYKKKKLNFIDLNTKISIFCNNPFQMGHLRESVVDSIKSTDGVPGCQFIKTLLGVLYQVCGILYMRGLQYITLIQLIEYNNFTFCKIFDYFKIFKDKMS